MSAATIWGAPEGFDALLLARRRTEHSGSVLHVARDDARMARLAEAIGFFDPEIEVLRFPAWDCLPYDRVSPNPAIVSERVATLARLLEPALPRRIVLTTVNALVQRVPPRHVLRGESRTLATNDSIEPDALGRFLEANGYGRSGTVMEPGEFAVRGGIIDIFPAGEAEPVRTRPVRRHDREHPPLRPGDPAQQPASRAAGGAPGLGRVARCRDGCAVPCRVA